MRGSGSERRRGPPFLPTARDPEWVEAGAPPPREVHESRAPADSSERPVWIASVVVAVVLGAVAFFWTRAASRARAAAPAAAGTAEVSPHPTAPLPATPSIVPAPPVELTARPDAPPAVAPTPARKAAAASVTPARKLAVAPRPPRRTAAVRKESPQELMRRRAFERARKLGATEPD